MKWIQENEDSWVCVVNKQEVGGIIFDEEERTYFAWSLYGQDVNAENFLEAKQHVEEQCT